MAYTGLSPAMRKAVRDRDGDRCRWCGATNQGIDIHHIEYRRGSSYDVLENLVCLCRGCHSFVHGNPRGNGARITKPVAQEVLFWTLDHPGTVGTSRWARLKREWTLAGLCEHGEELDACLIVHGRMRRPGV